MEVSVKNKSKRNNKPVTTRQRNRTMHNLCSLLAFAVYQSDDKQAESLLESIQPDGHRMAAFARYERRGPKALLTGGAA